MKVQAQHLQPGDIVGSGEKVIAIIIASIRWPSNKVHVALSSKRYPANQTRSVLWGKCTMINVERAE
jgi:hypothetical protein